MFENIRVTLLASSGADFDAMLLQSIMAAAAILCIFIVCLSLSYYIQKKEIKIKQKIKDFNETQKVSFFSRVFLLYGKLTKKTLIASMWVLSIYILLILIEFLLSNFSFHVEFLKEAKYDHIWISAFKTLMFYMRKIEVITNKLASLLINSYGIIILAVWAFHVIHYLVQVFLLKSIKNIDDLVSSSRQKARNATLNLVLKNVFKIVFTALALFAIMQYLGVNLATILATAGVASVAIGLGAQSLVKDAIGGFFIIFENQFAVGDAIEVNNYSGVVESMTLRVVRLLTSEGGIVVIPNGEIRIVKNLTTIHSKAEVKIFIPLIYNLEKATLIIKEECAEFYEKFKNVLVSPLEILPMEKLLSFENKTISASYKIMVKTLPGYKPKMEMELNQRLISKLKDANIFDNQKIL